MMGRLVFFRELFDHYGRGRYGGTEMDQHRCFRVWLTRATKAGRWPAAVKVGASSVAWWEHEVEAALDALPRVGYAPGATPEE